MPDLGPFVSALLELAGPAVGILLRTTLGMLLLSCGMAWAAYVIAAPRHGLLGALIALLLCAVIGAVLAVKRAILGALARGVARLGLGQRALGLVFERLLALSEAGEQGQRGGGAARALERLPLAQAEARLTQAVSDLLRGEGRGGWLRRTLEAQLLGQVQRLTLARFRQEDALTGGVDLLKVRDELSAQVDDLLRRVLEGALTKVTIALLLLASGLSLLSALALRGR